MEGFMQGAGEFFTAAGHILQTAWTYICAAVVWLGVVCSEFFQEHIAPALPTMTKLFNNATVNKLIFIVLAAYILIVNIVVFILYGTDKHRAKTKKNRIREKTLLRLCFFGGGAGSFLGMLIFNHKTKKKKFDIGVPIMFIIQLILGSFIFGYLGFWTFMH